MSYAGTHKGIRFLTNMRKTGAAVELENSKWERRFLELWEKFEGPSLVPQFKFHPKRKWRVDFFADYHNLLIELHGNHYSKSGHTSINGIERDREKAFAAFCLGYRYLELIGPQITEANLRKIIERLREGK
jgi:phage replication-related protein YjqB (UPF0714/DUF867 family)